MVDPGLIGAFKAGSERDVGHKLETAVFLECRRRAREWHYHAGDGELDLCDAEDRLFINACWNLSDAGTAEREAAAMSAGARLLPKAKGLLLYHEHAPDTAQRFPEAQPAWKGKLEPTIMPYDTDTRDFLVSYARDDNESGWATEYTSMIAPSCWDCRRSAGLGTVRDHKTANVALDLTDPPANP